MRHCVSVGNKYVPITARAQQPRYAVVGIWYLRADERGSVRKVALHGDSEGEEDRAIPLPAEASLFIGDLPSVAVVTKRE
jgi:hypothetical protein